MFPCKPCHALCPRCNVVDRFGVHRANILSAKAPNEEITFIHPSERELYSAWDSRTFDLQVANHELLGHGSGKQLQENADGTFKFAPLPHSPPMLPFVTHPFFL